MKRYISALFLTLVLALPIWAMAGLSNFGGVAVGDEVQGTYLVLTGVTEAYQEVELTSIMTGTNGTTALADSVITTGLYVANPTGLTLGAGVITYPVETDAAVARIRVPIPLTYRSGGRLLVDVHISGTITAGAITMTASATNYPISLTNTTLVSLAPVQISTTAATTFVTTAFPVGITPTPGSYATYYLTKTGGWLRTTQVSRVRFGYRPGSVINGQ